jgi:hypothetical protein
MTRIHISVLDVSAETNCRLFGFVGCLVAAQPRQAPRFFACHGDHSARTLVGLTLLYRNHPHDDTICTAGRPSGRIRLAFRLVGIRSLKSGRLSTSR